MKCTEQKEETRKKSSKWGNERKRGWREERKNGGGEVRVSVGHCR